MSQRFFRYRTNITLNFIKVYLCDNINMRLTQSTILSWRTLLYWFTGFYRTRISLSFFHYISFISLGGNYIEMGRRVGAAAPWF
jgi:hypothetical protein